MKCQSQAEKILEELMHEVSAQSCTLWVPDPWWMGEYRLLCMPGVKITEPMHGLLLPQSSRSRVAAGPPYEFFADADVWQLREDQPPPLSDFAKSLPQVYGDFVGREQIVSVARCVLPGELALFVNFGAARNSSSDLQAAIEKARDRLRARVEEWKRELSLEPFPVAELLCALEPTRLLAAFWEKSANLDNALRDYLNMVLKAAMDALHVSTDNGLGTIHLLYPEFRELRLFASQGRFDRQPGSQPLNKPFGIVSWVANKKRALLIADVHRQKSVFGAIHERVNNSTISELAVPMLAGDDCVLGVVNVESANGDAFHPIDVRTLWYSANQAAVAVQLARQVEQHQKLAGRSLSLFEGMQKVISEQVQPNRPFDFMATLLKDWAEADFADIWSRNFDEAGASYEEFSRLPLPRKDGWSNKILETGKPIWISEIGGHDKSRFSAHYWSDKWNDCRGDWPSGVNERLGELKVQCELGLPIQLMGKCIGVAWIKYQRACDMPSRKTMQTLEGFAANLGVVMDWWSARKAGNLFESSVAEFRKVLFAEPAPTAYPGVSAFALSHPEGDGQLGGDFYQFVSLNENGTRFGFVVGDIVGHGMPAALRMLPVLTTFRLFYRESNSTKFVVERLIKVANTLDIRATAMYAVVDMQAKPPLVFASSAGHPRLIIIDPSGVPILEFPEERAVRVPLGIGDEEVELFGEDVMPLDNGAVIIAYTDGVSEAGHEADRTLFGTHGIIQAALNRLKDGTTEQIATAIYEAARQHAGGKLADDATVLVIRVSERLPSHGKTIT